MSKRVDEVAVIIQARLGSQRIPQKMIKPFAQTTLTDIAIGKVLQCKKFPVRNFYLSVHEPELKVIAARHGVNVFHRSEASANSEGTPMTEMYEWWDKLPFKYCILIIIFCILHLPKTLGLRACRPASTWSNPSFRNPWGGVYPFPYPTL